MNNAIGISYKIARAIISDHSLANDDMKTMIAPILPDNARNRKINGGYQFFNLVEILMRISIRGIICVLVTKQRH